ncbi:hypothetical protein [Streptomyces sp. NPDC050564]|uniref:hypothetical protein n=1 Tax=Streptomyces sp. NPDC050564 TaxID=3365631 RepID=UPI00379C1B8A
MGERKSPDGVGLNVSPPKERPTLPEAGYPNSVHAAVNVAAPLLAGGAVAITGVIVADEEKFRWPGAAVLCLMLAIVSLIASIQLGFRARRYHFTSDELGIWFADTRTAAYYRDDSNRDWAIGTARNTWREKIQPAVHAYNLGTVLLGLGLSSALMPTSVSEQPNYRWAAAALALVATLVEVVWGWKLTMVRAPRPAPPRSDSLPLQELTDDPGGDSGSKITAERSGRHDA